MCCWIQVDELELIGPSLPPTDLLKTPGVHEESAAGIRRAGVFDVGCTWLEDRVSASLSIYSAGDIF